MELTEYVQAVTDPETRAARYAEVVPAYYAMATKVYQQIWSDSFHFTWFSEGQNLAEAQAACQQHLGAESGFTPGSRVIDIGCGIGGPTTGVATATGAHITGLNISALQVELAQQRQAERGTDRITQFRLGDMMNIPYPDGHFDGALSIEAICHAPNKGRAYREIARVVRDGGVFIGLDWFVRDNVTDEDYDRYLEPMGRTMALPRMISEREFLHAMADAGFAVDYLTAYQELGDISPNWELFSDAREGIAELKSGTELQLMAEALDVIRTAVDHDALLLGCFRARRLPRRPRETAEGRTKASEDFLGGSHGVRWHEPSSWRLTGSTWNDPTGSRRLPQIYPSLHDEPVPGSPTAWWICEEVDREAAEVGCLMLEVLAPAGPQDRDRDALAVLLGLTALNDSYSVTGRYEDIFSKGFCGLPVDDWLKRASQNLDPWTTHELRASLRIQVEALAAQRKEFSAPVGARFPDGPAQVRRNRDDYREYLRWRSAEGCYYGVLLIAAIASGMEIRDIPWTRIRDTLEAAVMGFDLHSFLRHHTEDETGNVLAYLPGSHEEKVTAGLGVVTRLHRLVAHATELTQAQKELLLRYMTSASLINYMPRRWSRTTPLHLLKPSRVVGGWSHVTGEPHSSVTLSDALGPNTR
ncbi:SAM-dependent methyltransferase [Streptomyces sp. NPDC001667]